MSRKNKLDAKKAALLFSAFFASTLGFIFKKVQVKGIKFSSTQWELRSKLISIFGEIKVLSYGGQ